jgi:NTE family protein
MAKAAQRRANKNTPAVAVNRHDLPGQVTLVFQGGGALGAYQVGVYQAMHEAGIEPQWVIGTSIGAINGAIIAGNPPEQRLAQLTRFWELMQHNLANGLASIWPPLGTLLSNLGTVTQGIEGFFKPNPAASWGVHTPLGVEHAAYYSTQPLQQTLASLVDFDCINAKQVRLTLGAVNVATGEMTYFDNRNCDICTAHVMASGALPPAFPAVRVDGEPYWDGGIYSNTPIEVVLDDKPRRDSLIFAANMWHPFGPEPETIWQVMGRQKDIQFSSRAKSHVKRQQQIHRLRHIIRELAPHIPAKERANPEVQQLLAYGCQTVMHIVRLLAPRIEGEDHTKDIDFTPTGIEARWQAGYADMREALDEAPWQEQFDTRDGIIVHERSP